MSDHDLAAGLPASVLRKMLDRTEYARKSLAKQLKEAHNACFKWRNRAVGALTPEQLEIYSRLEADGADSFEAYDAARRLA